MKITKLASLAACATLGLLAASAGIVAMSASPAQALSTTCQRTNDTDVALSAWATVESSVIIPYCGAGPGSQVRIDVHIKSAIAGDNALYVIQPSDSRRLLRTYSLDSASEINETYRWTTPALSAGTCRLQVSNASLYGTRGAYIDSWSLTVITPSCWGTNDTDAYSPAPQYLGDELTPRPASTSITVVAGCQGKASPDMRINAKLRNVFNGGPFGVHLFHNGVEVPMAPLKTIVTRTYHHRSTDFDDLEVSWSADGSQLDAAGTWTLQMG